MTIEEYVELIKRVQIYTDYDDVKDMTPEEGEKYLKSIPTWEAM